MKILRFTAIAALVAGCGGNELSGVKEYRQITAQALAAVQASIQALDEVSAQADHPSPKKIAAFEREVQRLQVDSIRVRARSQTILARGDAYFGQWSESLANIKDAKVRDLAERSHSRLEDSFSKIKASSRRAGAAFKPFLAGLQKLRVELETKPNELQTNEVTQLLRDARANGQQIVQQLEAIESELNSITSMLTPTKPEPLNWR